MTPYPLVIIVHLKIASLQNGVSGMMLEDAPAFASDTGPWLNPTTNVDDRVWECRKILSLASRAAVHPPRNKMPCSAHGHSGHLVMRDNRSVTATLRKMLRMVGGRWLVTCAKCSLVAWRK